MKILALESSAVSASVALTEDEKLVAQSFQNCGLTHSRTLLPMVENLLANCGVSLADVDAIAVAHGPGSFTGVRIGVATVKGLALGADKPCLGVSTLEAMAWGARALGGDLRPYFLRNLFSVRVRSTTRFSPWRTAEYAVCAMTVRSS